MWPQLETVKFVTGRSAVEEDVSEGRAVFVLKSGEKPIGHSIEMVIPQYAFHVDAETKEKTPCVLIQAEEADGRKYGGCRSVLDGSYLVGFISEFDLLGTKLPK
ncbi:MAG: hypothetical protein A3J87_04915 [Sideroxydans sp. RIFOXYB12_FULL_59_6]|nr:MAG: hypothetical protein A3J87_04915 [Sideroxydans sp. RIFOXYB12_FULL_59_6]